MALPVVMTRDARNDFEDIVTYILRRDSASRARHVLERIEIEIDGLTDRPQRGVYPQELVEIEIREYRELLQALPHRLPGFRGPRGRRHDQRRTA